MITFKTIASGTFLLGLSVLTKMFLIAKERNVKRHEIHIEKNKENVKQLTIFFISDIHRRKIDRRLLKKIGQSVDLVIIGGDLAEKGVPLSRIANNIEQLSTLGQIFYVWGNNDREVGEEQMRNIIQQFDGIILDNENQFIPNHPDWGIAGTDDPSWKMANPEKALQDVARYEHLLFVSHQPVVWRRAEQFYKPTFMLAGHTHGGQIRLGKFGISEKGFFKWTGNRGKLISNGYGTTELPLRFGAHPESHLIKITY